MTIEEFLQARLDEAELAAKVAGPFRIAWLTYLDADGRMLYTTVASDAGGGAWIADGRELPDPASVQAVHEPARVLRRIEADRRLIDQHVGYYGAGDDGSWPVQTLRHLAAAYDWHPDFKEAWRV